MLHTRKLVHIKEPKIEFKMAWNELQLIASKYENQRAFSSRLSLKENGAKFLFEETRARVLLEGIQSPLSQSIWNLKFESGQAISSPLVSKKTK